MENYFSDEPIIEVTRTEILPGRFEFSYKWIGDINAPIYINDFDIEKLPFPLKKLDFNPCMGDRYIRTDAKYWYLTYAKTKILRVLSFINNRLMMTAHVWGIVSVNFGEIPSWKRAFLNRWK